MDKKSREAYRITSPAIENAIERLAEAIFPHFTETTQKENVKKALQEYAGAIDNYIKTNSNQ